jgi:hypothetical protein
VAHGCAADSTRSAPRARNSFTISTRPQPHAPSERRAFEQLVTHVEARAARQKKFHDALIASIE